MATDLVWKVEEGAEVNLHDYDPDYTGENIKHHIAEKELQQLASELNDLQEALSAAQHNSILLILQGMDTSGKDGTIRHVLSQINPQGCSVYSFKEPTEEELAHDFLWRIHQAAPHKGSIGIFNRSQYEDVLIVRVHNLVPEKVWQRRYQEINNFEKLLADSNTIILKFFLHISYDEQAKRLQARVDDKDKAWKISASDWKERKYWNDYQTAYQDALSKCSTKKAPWYIVPANHKWYRNYAIAHTLVAVMNQYKDDWKADLEERGTKELTLLHQMEEGQNQA